MAAKASKRQVAVREMRVAVPDVSFDEIVGILKQVWTVPRIPGIGGCDPCRSGLDRFVIEDPLFRGGFGGR